MVLDDVQRAFVEQWGEMGARWGVSRSVAAVHAFLYLSEEALSADDLCEALSMARSNVSTALKELEGWELVFRESRMGDRKSYYRVQADVGDGQGHHEGAQEEGGRGRLENGRRMSGKSPEGTERVSGRQAGGHAGDIAVGLFFCGQGRFMPAFPD